MKAKATWREINNANAKLQAVTAADYVYASPASI